MLVKVGSRLGVGPVRSDSFSSQPAASSSTGSTQKVRAIDRIIDVFAYLAAAVTTSVPFICA